MPGFKGILRSALLFALLFVLSIPLAELAFRVLGGGPPEDLQGLYQPFGDISFKMAPLVDTGSEFASGRVTVHTDALGLRSDAARKFGAKPGDHLDALFLGDSQLFGSGLEYEETLVGRIAQHAETIGRRVATAAVNGHSVMEQFAVAKWLHDTNHVSVDTYVLLNTCLMVRTPEHYWAMIAGPDGRLYTSRNAPHLRLVSWLRGHTALFNRLNDARQNWRTRHSPFPLLFPVLIKYFGVETSEAADMREFLAALEQIDTWVKAQGAKLRVLYLPVPFEVQPGESFAIAQKRHVPLDFERPRRICEDAAKRLGLPFKSLLPEVRAYEKTGKPLELKGEIHFTGDFWNFSWRDVWEFLDLTPKSSAVLKTGDAHANSTSEATRG